MLSPALKKLHVELDQFDSHKRTDFENDLHRELLQVDKILAAARRFMPTEPRGKAADPPSPAAVVENLINWSSLNALMMDLNNLPSTMLDASLGGGPHSTTFNTKCSRQDCPNKRKK
jgi:hypothetical protein